MTLNDLQMTLREKIPSQQFRPTQVLQKSSTNHFSNSHRWGAIKSEHEKWGQNGWHGHLTGTMNGEREFSQKKSLGPKIRDIVQMKYSKNQKHSSMASSPFKKCINFPQRFPLGWRFEPNILLKIKCKRSLPFLLQ